MMRKFTKRLLIISVLPFLGLALSACAPKNPESQPECGFVQNVYGERISWKESVPIQLVLHESFPATMRPALENAIKVWEARLGRVLFQINDSYKMQGPIAPKQDGVNVIYWMNAWESEKASEQARTSVYWIGSQIQEADIRINDAYFDFYVDTPNSSRDVHLESLLIHELGHVLGLKHKDSGSSVMATYLASLTTREDIPDTDIQDVRCEY